MKNARILTHSRGVHVFAVCVLGVTLLAARPVAAAETQVRNDNLDDGGTGFVVGDFAAGEMAAVTLTSPCNGSIVAVQVLWLSALGGAQDTLEENIWIFDVASPSGVNKLPGSVLLQLEGPVLTPGFLNEFRYIDEGGTIPIDVPVTAGQQLVVALEFGVPTDIGNGSASVVRDSNGCQTGKNWLYGNIGTGIRWHNFCTFLAGDLVIRTIVNCDEPPGACCDAAAICVDDVQPSACQGTDQTFYVGQMCSQVTCPSPTGACCNGTGGCFDGQEQEFCEFVGGIYAGDGTLCVDQVCVLGACCLPTGECLQYVEAQCLSEGGTFQGAGTSCNPNPCPQPTGACCTNTGFCVPGQTLDACTTWPGEWAGPSTSCFTGICPLCDDGDADGDGDVDLDDFDDLQMCLADSADGAGVCKCLDMDNNNIVDLIDHSLFELSLTGP